MSIPSPSKENNDRGKRVLQENLPLRVRLDDQTQRTVLGGQIIPVSEDDGGAYRDRTDDPLLAKQMLSQLS